MTGLDGARCSVEYRLPSQEELQLELLPILLVGVGANFIVLQRLGSTIVPIDDESRFMNCRGFGIFLPARLAGRERMHDVFLNQQVVVPPLRGRFAVVLQPTRAAQLYRSLSRWVISSFSS
eukprot:TRINITY_DN1677_c0_g1_i1.p1 TRINITY_DN1677_c0_g1~~TRINITY_DN1677_c0_g1_i1.p1  ORF type:complete len:121 (-),score=10.99 TRINITY_DN1677_c0_g1_i1:7-369(-)